MVRRRPQPWLRRLDGWRSKRFLLSGNIGFPASQVAQTCAGHGIVFLPVMGIEDFHPQIAVITNLMPTHLDYPRLCWGICSCQVEYQKNMTADDYLVLNFNQELGQEMASQTQAIFVPFNDWKGGWCLFRVMSWPSVEKRLCRWLRKSAFPGDHNAENALLRLQ